MLGIDIGTNTIKVIDLVKGPNLWDIKASGLIGFQGPSPDMLNDSKEYENFASVLSKLVEKIGVKGKEAVVSIPEPLVFTRVVKFPRLSDEEVNAAVKWEAEQYIPIPISEAIIQHSIIDNSETSSDVKVLLIAAPKSVVEKYVKVVRMAGMNVVAAETEMIALSRSLSPVSGTILLLDMDVKSTNMAVVSNSKLLSSRSIPIAGEAFTRAVSQGLGVNEKQAEEYKKVYGMVPNKLEGKVRNLIAPVMSSIVDEIKKAVHFSQTEFPVGNPESVVMTGSSSIIPDLAVYLTENTGLETIMGNPFQKVNMDEDSRKSLLPYVSYYSVAVGLAMRED